MISSVASTTWAYSGLSGELVDPFPVAQHNLGVSRELPLFSLTAVAHAAPLKAAGGRDPMFILLNGAFGIGKTTAACALLRQVTDSRLYDPEPVGVALQHLSTFLRPRGRIEDFQDLASRRKIAAWGARRRHRGCAVVIVPMAFSNLAYLESLKEALARSNVVHKLCLVAPIDVIRERLRRRAEAEGAPIDQWALERAETCCEAHRSPAFGHPIDATTSTGEIVRSIFELIALQ